MEKLRAVRGFESPSPATLCSKLQSPKVNFHSEKCTMICPNGQAHNLLFTLLGCIKHWFDSHVILSYIIARCQHASILLCRMKTVATSLFSCYTT